MPSRAEMDTSLDICDLGKNKCIMATSKELSDDLFETKDFGFMPLQTVVRLHDDNPERTFTREQKDFLKFLHTASSEWDSNMSAHLSRLIREGQIAPIFSKKEVSGFQERYLDILANVVEANNTEILCPMYGAASILKAAKERGISEEHLFPGWIAGTVSTSTGEAKILRPLPAEILDPARYIIAADDVLDSNNSILRLALERRLKRLGSLGGEAKLPEEIQVYRNNRRRIKNEIREITESNGFYTQGHMQKLLKDLEIQEQMLQTLYQVVAELFMEEKVVIAPLFNKNPMLKNALLDRGTIIRNSGEIGLDEKWYEMQKNMLGVTSDVSEDQWIIGGKGKWELPLLDTGLEGTDLLAMIPENDSHRPVIDYLQSVGLPGIYIRWAAAIPELVEYIPGGMNGIDAMTEAKNWFARICQEYAEKKIQLK